jgi:hypothetical protein
LVPVLITAGKKPYLELKNEGDERNEVFADVWNGFMRHGW